MCSTEIKFQGVIQAVAWTKDILWTNNNSQRCQMMFQGFNIIHVNFKSANISQTCSTVTFFFFSTLLSNTRHQRGLMPWNRLWRALSQSWEDGDDVCCCCLVAQSCPFLCDPVDCSLLDSSVHGISQARVLECHFLFQEIFPDPGIEPASPAWQANS